MISAESEPMLRVSGLAKRFPEDGGRWIHAVDDVSFSVDRGSFFTLLGPSGCGKTTTLRSVAGLEDPEAGEIIIGDRVVFSSARRIATPPHKRGIGMVFQSYAIWPHMSCFENVAFPLRAQSTGLSRRELSDRVMEALETMGLGGLANRPATNLSGGQQQRLALARALVWKPQLLLLDEPLSNLDAKLREQMRVELKRLQAELGITALYVTHDQVEALSLSTKIAVMSHGRVVQLGTPREVYERPSDLFVANFVGTSNLVGGTVVASVDEGSSVAVEWAGGTLTGRTPVALTSGESVRVVVRPEVLQLREAALPPPTGGGEELSANWFGGKIASRLFLGEATQYVVASEHGQEFIVKAGPRAPHHTGDEVLVQFPSDDAIVLPAAKDVSATDLEGAGPRVS